VSRNPALMKRYSSSAHQNITCTFKLFDKVKVLGDDKTPLYNRLVNNAPETGDIGWNFEKFLVDKKGNIVGRYKSKVKPDSEELVSAINAELSK
jgi:glutathione peroxidase